MMVVLRGMVGDYRIFKIYVGGCVGWRGLGGWLRRLSGLSGGSASPPAFALEGLVPSPLRGEGIQFFLRGLCPHALFFRRGFAPAFYRAFLLYFFDAFLVFGGEHAGYLGVGEELLAVGGKWCYAFVATDEATEGGEEYGVC